MPHLFLICLQYPLFLNMHRCLRWLNGKVTIVIDGPIGHQKLATEPLVTGNRCISAFSVHSRAFLPSSPDSGLLGA
jgi:hypothetical protein